MAQILESTISKWRTKVREQNGTLSVEQIDELLEELVDQDQEPPSVEWGNCRRGCVPSYLDEEGYCSPACDRGQKKGE
jgi:hypothetical protein